MLEVGRWYSWESVHGPLGIENSSYKVVGVFSSVLRIIQANFRLTDFCKANDLGLKHINILVEGWWVYLMGNE